VYRGEVELRRPGAYMATLLDEALGKTVATTGAILSAGDELRSAGVDRALLGRIAKLTGGRLRDTLAGMFADRELERMAYQSFTSMLLVLAALALLLGVASRRLAVPDAVAAAPARLLRYTRRETSQRAAKRLEVPDAPQLQALERVRAKHRRTEPEPEPRRAGFEPTAIIASPPASTPAPAEHREAPPASHAQPGLTAAEILLARRRRRR
jgi:hypothetical protein